jgi:hypothetical protein
MAGSELPHRFSRRNAARPRYRRRLLFRPFLDAAVAGLVFVLLTGVCISAPVKACPFSALSSLKPTTDSAAFKAVGAPAAAPIIEIATTSSDWDPNAVFRRTSGTAAWSLLGLSFSLLVALNLSFFRHLRRVYASPRARGTVPK